MIDEGLVWDRKESIPKMYDITTDRMRPVTEDDVKLIWLRLHELGILRRIVSTRSAAG
jgi:hypothetical protein